MPLVSVIVPNYNHAKYLPQRIESVLLQSFQDFELIILDDASIDNSREVINNYAHHPKVSHVVFNEYNSGSTFKQWQKGIALAEGEWIWIAESDDWCEFDLLSNLLNGAIHNANCTISYCQSYYREEGSAIIQDMSFHTDSLSASHWKKNYVNRGEDEISNFLLYKNTIPNASAVIFKKNDFMKVDKSFVNMKLCGDWMLWMQLLKIGNIFFCATPLNNFRSHDSTTRVLNSLDKKRRRLEEEYHIVLDIKNTYPSLSFNANNRIKDIIREYNMCFENNRHIFFYFIYKGKIPYAKLLLFKIRDFLSI